MGCAQSIDTDGRGDVGGKRWKDRDARMKRHEVRADAAATGAGHSVDPTVLSQPLLDDLRIKMRLEALCSPPIAKWIENITEPSVDDNADLYDPLRRHRLAMESVASRQRRSITSSSSTSQNVSHPGELHRKAPDSEGDATVAENAVAHHDNIQHTTSITGTAIEDTRGLDEENDHLQHGTVVDSHGEAQRTATPTGADDVVRSL